MAEVFRVRALTRPWREPFDVRTIAGTYRRVEQWYPHGPFALHRGMGRRGWTVTHLKTREAVLQRIPSLHAARYVADRLSSLTGQWTALTRPYDLWREIHEVFNVRERYALAVFVTRMQKEWGCL